MQDPPVTGTFLQISSWRVSTGLEHSVDEVWCLLDGKRELEFAWWIEQRPNNLLDLLSRKKSSCMSLSLEGCTAWLRSLLVSVRSLSRSVGSCSQN